MSEPAAPPMGFAAARDRILAEMGAVTERPPEVIAVAKTKPVAAVREALAAGHRLFGENRVQEAALKYPQLRADYPDLELHLIGPLQTNKVRQAVALFDLIQTLDRDRLARALAEEMDRQQRRIPCLIQVNTGEEAQKAGVAPDGVADLLDLARSLALPVIGLMCIPPVDEEPALHFALLADLAAGLGLPMLSMGMSGDYVTAARHGATHVRIGSALFGARPPAPAARDDPVSG